MDSRLAKSFKMFVLITLCVSLTVGVVSGMAVTQEKKVIRCFVQSYTPRERTEADRWDPPQYYWKLEQEYERLHPDIDIQFLKPIVGEYEAWFVTQMTGETAPEILWRHIGAAKADYVKGWYLDFTPYLEKPNPYVEGNDHWKDLFIPAVSETAVAPDGKTYVLGVDIVGVGIYYNKNIFAEAGVTLPSTWKEFMDIQEKIKSAGYIPTAFPLGGTASNPGSWSVRLLQDMTLDSKMMEIKTGVKAAKGVVERTREEGGSVSWMEIVRAIKLGIYSAKDPQWQEQWRLLKEWSTYWQKGFLAAESVDAYRLYITGKAAMIYDGSWQVKPTEVDSLREFDFGLFNFPKVTKESSPYATGIGCPSIGGAGAGAGNFCVPLIAKERGLADETIDWLMFVTAPQNLVPLCNDLGSFAPALKETEGVDPRLLPFIKQLEKGSERIRPDWCILTPEYAQQHYRILQEYIGGKLTMDEATDKLQREMEKGADILIDQNPEWGLEK